MAHLQPRLSHLRCVTHHGPTAAPGVAAPCGTPAARFACTHVVLLTGANLLPRLCLPPPHACLACTPAVLPLHINGNFLGEQASATYSVFMKFTMANMEIGDAKMWWGAGSGWALHGCICELR